MTRVRTAALALVVNALLVVPAFAWTPAGHMSVAFVAYNALRLATRTRVDALLRLNPLFPIWSRQVASLPAADRGRAIFMLAATWADGIKWMSDYTDVDPAHKFRPKGTKSAQNIGYADKFRHQYWHFIDLPFATTPSLSLPSVPTPNVQERITLFLNTLRSTARESIELSKTKVYRMPIGPGNGPFKVDSAYESNKQAVARERAALGAARLAAVLNANVK